MNFFNLRSKSNNSSAEMPESAIKSYQEDRRWRRDRSPTTEEAIRVIVSQFTESQLKTLEIVCRDKTIIPFEKRLSIYYSCLYPSLELTLQDISSKTKELLNRYGYLFDLPDTRVVFVFFKHELEHFFTSHYY